MELLFEKSPFLLVFDGHCTLEDVSRDFGLSIVSLSHGESGGRAGEGGKKYLAFAFLGLLLCMLVRKLVVSSVSASGSISHYFL